MPTWPKRCWRALARGGRNSPPSTARRRGGGRWCWAWASLGAGRLNATSDLDLIVIYDADGVEMSMGPPLGRAALLRAADAGAGHGPDRPDAEGRLYEVDMRLRPSGHAGAGRDQPHQFRDYQMNEAWVWEHLALTRARPWPARRTCRRCRRPAPSACWQRKGIPATRSSPTSPHARPDRRPPNPPPGVGRQNWPPAACMDVELIGAGGQPDGGQHGARAREGCRPLSQVRLAGRPPLARRCSPPIGCFWRLHGLEAAHRPTA
jgi:hypothetical protein